jgi:hypothetical protein
VDNNCSDGTNAATSPQPDPGTAEELPFVVNRLSQKHPCTSRRDVEAETSPQTDSPDGTSLSPQPEADHEAAQPKATDVGVSHELSQQQLFVVHRFLREYKGDPTYFPADNYTYTEAKNPAVLVKFGPIQEDDEIGQVCKRMIPKRLKFNWTEHFNVIKQVPQPIHMARVLLPRKDAVHENLCSSITHPLDDPWVPKFSDNLTLLHLMTLRSQTVLDSMVIDEFICLLNSFATQERKNETVKLLAISSGHCQQIFFDNRKVPNTYARNNNRNLETSNQTDGTGTYKQFSESGTPVCDWTFLQICAHYAYVCLPVVNRCHWFLCVFVTGTKTLIVFDSDPKTDHKDTDQDPNKQGDSDRNPKNIANMDEPTISPFHPKVMELKENITSELQTNDADINVSVISGVCPKQRHASMSGVFVCRNLDALFHNSTANLYSGTEQDILKNPIEYEPFLDVDRKVRLEVLFLLMASRQREWSNYV